MSVLQNWMALSALCLLASMVPGLSFALVLKNTLSNNRLIGISTAAGLAAGMSVHALLVILGLSSMLTGNVLVFQIMQLCGACYLGYVGFNSLFRSQNTKMQNIGAELHLKSCTPRRAFVMGALTNLLNPKVIIFFLALFAQFLVPGMLGLIQWIYGFSAIFIEFIWFTTVAVLFSHALWQNRLQHVGVWLERLSGIILLALGLQLLFRNFHFYATMLQK